MTTETPTQSQLVDAKGLLEALFDTQSRPSLRWLRQLQAQRKISFRKIGHLVFFDVDQVRAEIESNCTIHSRAHLRSQK